MARMRRLCSKSAGTRCSRKRIKVLIATRRALRVRGLLCRVVSRCCKKPITKGASSCSRQRADGVTRGRVLATGRAEKAQQHAPGGDPLFGEDGTALACIGK